MVGRGRGGATRQEGAALLRGHRSVKCRSAAVTLTILPVIFDQVRETKSWDMVRAILRACSAFVLAVMVSTNAMVRAENLDEGKSATRLFADSCTACHRSPRGLTKGRIRLTLYFFLQQHYATNSASAWELASYVESIDDAPRGRSHAGASKRTPQADSRSDSSLRPADDDTPALTNQTC